MLNKKIIEHSFNFILFGASGDLARLKIFPSLYELALQKRFPKNYTLYGYARTEMTDDEFRALVKKSIQSHIKKVDPKVLKELLSHMHYHTGSYDDPESYHALAEKLNGMCKDRTVETLAFYAVPPVAFKTITQQLAGMRETLRGGLKIMIEKPFGHDYESASKWFRFITRYFEKDDVFLMDHYLGKSSVKSILPLRYHNSILNLLLKGSAIANIQISAVETLGVNERIGFFDQVGIVKDMIQSHLLQVLALLTMNMPIDETVKNIRREKGNILSALRYDDEKSCAVLGQYKSYREQKGVDADSMTPTFAALRCHLDLTDWYQVPIYIRAGKKLTHKHTYVVIEFKKPVFQTNAKVQPNRLVIELYPKEEIRIHMVNKSGELIPSEMQSGNSLACSGEDCLPPYGRLILNAALGEQKSFLSVDEILASWHFIDDVMDAVANKPRPLAFYEDGSEGPKEQFQITKHDGFEWFDPE